MKNLAAWFTTERRQLIQAFLGSLAVLAVSLGYGTQGQAEQALIISAAAMQFVASMLSLVNVRIADWATKGWAIVRAAVYLLASTVSPALVIIGLYREDVNTQILTGVSLGLSTLSSLIAILASGKQANVIVVQETRDRAVIEALTASPPAQVATLYAAAGRLGVEPTAITRAQYRTADDNPAT